MTVSALLAIIALGAWSPPAQAQAWPDKPIRFIVPSPPGGGTDSLTRLLANKLGELLKWHMVVDNRPGAGGNLGLDIAAKAAPDGYTLVMGESSNLAITPSSTRSCRSMRPRTWRRSPWWARCRWCWWSRPTRRSIR